MAERRIYAAYDDKGIYIYQAFRASIAKAALEQGTFGGGGYNLERMSWIKPSFGWMLYRAGYGLKTDQECILKIKLRHEGFQQALRWAVESVWNPGMFDLEDDWRQALQQSPVRLQWDPDRDLEGRKLERRAIQIGLRGRAIDAYVHEWIIGLEEVTGLAHSIKEAKDNGRELPQVPHERMYPVVNELVKSLGITPELPN